MSTQAVIKSLSLIHYLRRRGQAPLKELESRFDLTRDQLLEVLDSLNNVGVPPYGGGDYIQVVFDREDNVRLGATRHFRGAIKLNLEEITALRLWLVSTSAGDDPWRHVVRDLLEKIEDCVGDGSFLSMDLHRLREVDRRGQNLTRLDQALRERKTVDFNYFSTWRDSLKRFQVEPLGLIDRRGVWLLVGRDCAQDVIKDFRVDRIESLELTLERFDRAASIDLDEHLEKPFRQNQDLPHVTLRAWGPLRRELEEIGAALYQQGESLLARVPVASIPWLVSWLLSYPEHLDLVDAGSLKEQIKERLDKLKASSLAD